MLRYAVPAIVLPFALLAVPAQGVDTPAAKTHWAFKAPVRPTVPAGANPIDHFIRARLNKEKLKPAQEADRVTLCRRLYLDLIGLPPTPKEVDEFVSDKRADAYE